MEYLRSLRYYGIQKTDDKTEYNMMKDSGNFNCLGFLVLWICNTNTIITLELNKNVLGIDFYLDIEQEREQRLIENGISD